MRVERMLISWEAIASGAEKAGIGDDADRAWMLGIGILQSQDDIEEQPVAIEESLQCVDQMLQHLEDGGEGSRCTDKPSGTFLGERSEVFILVATIVDQQSCEMLLAVHLERNAELAMTAATVTTHGEEGRLRTQDRHVAERVSDVRAFRERACLCGVCGSVPLETHTHRSFGRQQERPNGASSCTLGGGEVNDLRRRDGDRSNDC